ncbi:MAG TPA: hemerythrin domain-containing protein [Burkholderiaceae bacterium]|nr:hemerythrin domain-containing protein [Burkholderiaceae bacterium]
MDTTNTPVQPGQQARADDPGAKAPAGRRDFYAPIHKALRLFMTRTLCTVGSTDPADAREVRATLDLVARLLALCESHLGHENAFVHPALERASPGSAARVTGEHEHHVEAIADLRDLAALVADCRDDARGAALARLYRTLALFVADNFQHMHVEETAHNAVLWAAYSDAELEAIEKALVASIPPAEMFEALHWFVPALSAPERAAMLGGMRQGMPPEPFAAVLAVAQRTLSSRDHARLLRDLGLGVAEQLVAA